MLVLSISEYTMTHKKKSRQIANERVLVANAIVETPLLLTQLPTRKAVSTHVRASLRKCVAEVTK